MKILHLLGARSDNGGILSTLRGLHQVADHFGLTHQVWVHSDYEETRLPPLTYLRSPLALDEAESHLYLLWTAIRAFPGLLAALKRERPNVIHAHSRGSLPLALFLARFQSIPVLFTNHAYARKTGMYRWAATKGRLSTVVLTPNMARHYGLSVDHDPVRIVSECAIDAHFQRPLASRDTGRSRIRLLGLGNLVEWKNWHLLLEALSTLEDADLARLHLDIWGPTPPDPAAQAYAARLHDQCRQPRLVDRVTLHGPTNQIHARFNKSDWFVLPSTNEPCSVALIEALAHGVPVLTSASGGNVDIVKPEVTGVFFEPGSVEALAEQLKRIARNEIVVAPP